MPVRRAWGEFLGAFHPIVVFGLQLREIVDKDLVPVTGGDEFDHARKERRLGAAQVVTAVAIWHVTIPVDM